MQNSNTQPIQLKSAIIGKMWINQDGTNIVPSSFTLPVDMSFNANESYLINNLTFRTDRNLNSSTVEGSVAPVSVKAGDKLFFYANNKRSGFKDADYSVSIQVSAEVADAIIANAKKGIEAWRVAHPANI